MFNTAPGASLFLKRKDERGFSVEHLGKRISRVPHVSAEFITDGVQILRLALLPAPTLGPDLIFNSAHVLWEPRRILPDPVDELRPRPPHAFGPVFLRIHCHLGGLPQVGGALPYKGLRLRMPAAGRKHGHRDARNGRRKTAYATR